MITSTFTPDVNGPTDTLTAEDCAAFTDGTFATGSQDCSLVAIGGNLYARNLVTGNLTAVTPGSIAVGILFHRVNGELDITLKS